MLPWQHQPSTRADQNVGYLRSAGLATWFDHAVITGERWAGVSRPYVGYLDVTYDTPTLPTASAIPASTLPAVRAYWAARA